MRKLILALAAAIIVQAAHAQEITSYDVDSTAIYNAMYNPSDYAQAPVTLPQRKVLDRNRISTQINMGTSISSIGSSEYINPNISYQATDRLSLSFGMGIMYSNLKLRNFEDETSAESSMRAITNYYSVAASYRVSPKCDVYGSLIYMRDDFGAKSQFSPQNRYMATFGATFNITESLSIGIELRKSENMSPFYTRGYNPYGWGM